MRHLQRVLAHLGYVVRADGQFGPHTAQVVRAFRSEVGLARSSRVTARFVRMLHRAQNGGPGDLRWLGIRRLAVGTRGRDVRLLQKDLTRLGYTAATDGQFGPQTRLSVRSFERAAGLKIDGVMSLREARTLKKVVRSGREAGAVSQEPTTSTAPVDADPADVRASAGSAHRAGGDPTPGGGLDRRQRSRDRSCGRAAGRRGDHRGRERDRALPVPLRGRA